MKKRLLSAALALAMVLTMLPLTAFATDAAETLTASGTYTVTYRAAGYVFKAATTTTEAVTAESAGYYYYGSVKAEDGTTSTKLLKASDGVLAGTSTTSGVWYSSLEEAVKAKKTQVVLLGDASSGLGSTNLDTSLVTSLTIDLNGHTLGGTINIPATYVNSSGTSVNNTFTTLTIKDSTQTGTNYNSTGSSFSITVGNGTAKATNTTITLQNVQTSSTITANYTTACTISLKNAKAGDITLTGTSGGAVNVGTSTSEKGEAGAVSITTTGTATGGKVTAYNATLSSVALSGVGANLTGTNSNVGTVTLFGHDSTGLTDAQKGSLAVPSVALTGGSATSIKVASGKTEALTKAYSVTLKENANGGEVELDNAGITVQNSKTTSIALKKGSLSVTGSATGPAATGNLTLSDGTDKGAVSLTVTGSNVTVGAITASSNNVSITVPNEASNTFGALTADSGLANRGIAGGVWAGAVPAASLVNTGTGSLRYQVARNGGTYVYYTSSQFQNLIDEYQKDSSAEITIVQDSEATKDKTITFKNGDETLTVIKFGASSLSIPLPTTVNGGAVAKWTEYDSDSTTILSEPSTNYSTPSPAGSRVLNAQVTDNTITKLEGVASSVNGVTVRLNGNVITLSGAIPSDNMEIKIQVTTDGTPKIDEEIAIVYDNGSVRFANQNASLGGGMRISTDYTTLVMPNGTNMYTLNGSGLKVQASGLPAEQVIGYTGDCPVVVTVNCSGTSWTTVRKNELANAMSSVFQTSDIYTLESNTSTVNFSGSPAVKELLNAVVAGITDSQINSWITAAQNASYKKAGYTGTPDASQRAATGYNKVYVVAYMAVNITNYNTSNTPGTLTMTLTPSYYVEVRRDSNVSDGANGKALDPSITSELNVLRPRNTTLGSLTGEVGTIELEIQGETAFKVANAVAHQGGTYAYPFTWEPASASVPATQDDVPTSPAPVSPADGTIKFYITHKINNALGTFIIDGNAPMVTLYDDTNETTTLGYYDTLQAAVDDAEDKQYIDVDANYQGSCQVNMTGKARTITVNTNGKNRVTSNATGTVVEEKAAGTLFQLQLTASTNTTTNNTSVGVNSATGGTARVSATSAKPGDTITITTTASSGYTAQTPAVRTNTGTSVPVTASASNVWTFVIPTGATAITVTPSFVLASGLPFTDVAATAWYYEGVAYCYNKITPTGDRLLIGYDGDSSIFGPTRTITRAEVAQILYRLGNGKVETPTTAYTDVSSALWYYNPIVWATNHGYVIGNGDGTFRPNDPITRQEFAIMLWRFAGKPTVNIDLTTRYTDGSSVATWGTEAMSWAAGYGILSGTDSVSLNGSMSPKTSAFRSQVAVTLWKYCQLYG